MILKKKIKTSKKKKLYINEVGKKKGIIGEGQNNYFMDKDIFI